MKRNTMQQQKKIPVTILTGFLGSGKTTLLNWILQKQHGKKIAVIENEFGEVGVDDMLVKEKQKSSELVVEMNNGCICCTVRGDLIKAFASLMKRQVELDAIIIETTGLADPAPVCQTFFVDDTVSSYAKLDAVVTIVDAKHILQHLDEVKPEGVENESVEQIAFADRIIINKLDLVDDETAKTVEQRVKKLNSHVKIIKAKLNSECVPLDEILGLEAFSLNRVLELEPEFLKDQEHLHDQSVGSVGFKFVGDMHLAKFQNWISEFLKTYGVPLFRYKGIISVKGKDEKFVFQGVHMLFDGTWSEKWNPTEIRENRFCFIGKNLPREEIQKKFMGCVAGELRFSVGDAVQCNVGNYVTGTVMATWDEGNAYRVRLLDGTEVWAPEDINAYIRKKKGNRNQ